MSVSTGLMTSTLAAQRLGLILGPDTPGWARSEDAANINGPCLVRAPSWVPNPLGRYYLYFAHHAGTHIRLAYADRPEGPWRVHGPGALTTTDAGFGGDGHKGHVASPEVIVDDVAQRVYLFCHGTTAATTRQPRAHASRMLVSADGLAFTAPTELLAPTYLRVFKRDSAWYGIAKQRDGVSPQVLLRAERLGERFVEGASFRTGIRHVGLLVRGDRLLLVFSRAGDAPEHIAYAVMSLQGDWRHWPDSLGDEHPLLMPEESWEGAGWPVAPSLPKAETQVRQLRDPFVFEDGERALLLYTVAGEGGIGLAELTGTW
jgi:hypothetical protein